MSVWRDFAAVALISQEWRLLEIYMREAVDQRGAGVAGFRHWSAA